jgi:hypothetical protein
VAIHPLETYLRELHDIRATGAGVKETSFYPALANLLNAVGQTLKPRVRCVINLKNLGAGMPDGGLFTLDQLQTGNEQPLEGQLPARGAIECKGTRDEAWVTADTEQVSKYWKKYRQVLVTNYRDFVLVGQDGDGRPVKLEMYRLAESEKAFWKAAAHPGAVVGTEGDRFVDYLRRVMLHAAPLAHPKDVAWFLASYARDARARMADAELPALNTVRKALQEALGITFEGTKKDPKQGERFFRSTLVQTLFYGVFSAWVLWHRAGPPPGRRFDWEKASKYLHVPILRKLFRELADPVQLGEWKLFEVLEWTAGVLNRVDRDAFFAKFRDAEAVQYFYEPFLEAFDPELRKQLGVWYTPPEIVRYMVARVDTVLREELGRADGLADPSVYVLDPCCGTGAYLTETLRTIAGTLKDRGEGAMLGGKLKAAAMERIFGFEILPAPFVVAHLQLGLFLQGEGVPLDDTKHERAGVFLTNALTDWEPPKGPKQHLLFPEMEEERDKAEAVKQRTPLLVVLGNPPYNGFAGVAVAEERDLSDAYRTTERAPKPQGQGLNDLYVRFFRMAERCIVEREPRQGVVCFISNYSWLDGLSFPGMRERYLKEFDLVLIDNLHGNRFISEYAPDGRTSETVFAIQGSSVGIKIGTAIATLVRRNPHVEIARVLYRDWTEARATERRAALLTSLKQENRNDSYIAVRPAVRLGLPFRPHKGGGDYLSWPRLTEIFAEFFAGVKTSHDDLVVDIDREQLIAKLRQFCDPSVREAGLRNAFPYLSREDLEELRPGLIKRRFAPRNPIRYAYRPFDNRWICWDKDSGLVVRSRADYYRHVLACNVWLEARQKTTSDHFDRGYVTRILADSFGNGLSSFFPLYLSNSPQLAPVETQTPNLSAAAEEFIKGVGGEENALFYHLVSVLHSPLFGADNADALRLDWPRVPLPGARQLLLASGALGRQVAALLGTEAAVNGVTAGNLRAELKVIGVPARVGGGNLNPLSELDVTARWGIAGKGGVCMPAKGKVTERAYVPEERAAVAQGAAALGLDEATALACLGEKTCDVYLNNVAYWRNVPAKVWAYTLGGYQVVKKWLSYREKALLGRGLRLEEVGEVRDMARRIAALLLLRPALDVNYQAVKAAPYSWPRTAVGLAETDTPVGRVSGGIEPRGAG